MTVFCFTMAFSTAAVSPQNTSCSLTACFPLSQRVEFASILIDLSQKNDASKEIDLTWLLINPTHYSIINFYSMDE